MKNKLLLMLVLGILVLFLTLNVSAFERDNIMNYDEETKTVEIRNSILGIPFLQLDKVAEIQLNTPLNYKVGYGAYTKVAEFEVRSFEDYENSFKELELYNKKNNDQKFTRDFTYRILTYEDIIVDDYGEVNVGKTLNNSIRWERQIIGNHIEQKENWMTFNVFDFTDGENLTIGIFTDVKKGDYIEWIPNFFGIRIDEWATWTADLNTNLQVYYNFNNSGNDSNLVDQIRGQNGILINSPTNVTGIVGNALRFTNTSMQFINITNSTGFFNWSELTISFWIYPIANFTTVQYFWDGFDARNYHLIQSASAGWDFRQGGTTATFSGVGEDLKNEVITSWWTLNEWHHIAIVYNSSGNNSFWADGSNRRNSTDSWTPLSSNFTYLGAQRLQSTNLFANYRMDEFALWSRLLSDVEILDNFNNGSGITRVSVDPGITLNSPADNLNTVNQSFIFNATIVSLNGIINVTLFIDDISNETNSSGLNDTFYTFRKRVLEGTHNWSIESCNSLDCATSSLRNFTMSRMIFESETFDATILEGQKTTFTANVLTNGTNIITGNLSYNNTENLADISQNGNNFTINVTFFTPSVGADTNISFFWNFTQQDGFTLQTSAQNQTVQTLTLDNCSTNTNLILNYTLRDEEKQTILVGSSDNTTMDIDVTLFTADKSQELVNFSRSYNQTNPAQVCLNLDLTTKEYQLDATNKYVSDTREIEYHNIQGFIVKNSSVPQNINLFDLLSTDSTEFQITFKDANFVVVENALINVDRQYVSEGVFKTVEIPKTDSNGQAVVHLVEKDIVYNFIVIKDGVILGTFNNLIAFCEDVVIGSCFITLNALQTNLPIFDYDNIIGLAFSFSYNETTRILTFPFVTTDGGVKNITLQSVKLDRLGNTSVCSETLISSSGTISCSVPASIGNETIIVSIFVNGDLKITNYVSAGKDFDIGNTGYFLLLILLIFLITMFIESKAGVIIGTLTGFIIGSLFSWIEGGILGVGSLIIWMTIAGGILMWKLNEDNQT